MLDDARDPNERSDVFSIGVLLWELLTGKTLFGVTSSALDLGHNFRFPKITHSTPEGTKVPQGLVHAVHTALEPEPLKRQASSRELAVAIVMGVEEVATYQQVIEFTDAILEPRLDGDSQPQANQPEQLAASVQSAPIPDVPLLDRPPAPKTPLNNPGFQASHISNPWPSLSLPIETNWIRSPGRARVTR